MSGISTLDRFIQILQSSKTEFTAAHCEYVRLCIAAKCYQHSLKHIEAHILSVKQVKKEKDFSIEKNSSSILNYFYDVGLIFLKLERWEDAYLSFAKVLALPYLG